MARPHRGRAAAGDAPRRLRIAATLAPLLLVPLLFVAVLRSGEPAPLWRRSLPREGYRPDRCTWDCHNHGCRHRPVLGRFLAGDDGLFGATVHALHGMGRVMAPGRGNVGYGAANLLVFCLVWPGGMLALWLVALRQRRQLRELRAARPGAAVRPPPRRDLGARP
jgi:hypothetical protein